MAVAAGRVFGRKLDVVDVLAREPDGFARLRERLFTADLELVLQVQVGRGEKDVNPRLLGGFDGAGSEFDVLLAGAGQRRDAWAANRPGDIGDGVEVAFGGDGEAGFENVDAKVGQVRARA